jgi:hypothetical protein
MYDMMRENLPALLANKETWKRASACFQQHALHYVRHSK